MFKTLLFALVALSSSAFAEPLPFPAVNQALVHDLCGKQVVLLGENDHGDGRTVEFKAALVRQLVTRCHFNAVFFEGSFYDFLAVQRQVRLSLPITTGQVSSSVGGIWNHDEEMVPLISFLTAEARSGHVHLGGMDDQLGSAGAFYSLKEMPDELASLLPDPSREECRNRLTRRANYEGQFTEGDMAKLQSCLADISSAVQSAKSLGRAMRDERLGMIASLRRAIPRAFLDTTSNIVGRDDSMYDNFRWLADRLPPHSKIIVWTATAHAAKDASALPEYATGKNLGAYLHRAYGEKSFVLGFSALAGAHFWSRGQPSRPIPTAAPDSLEGRAMANGARDIAYLGPAALKMRGRTEGSALSFHKPFVLRWADVLDGLIISRAERPAIRTDLTAVKL